MFQVGLESESHISHLSTANDGHREVAVAYRITPWVPGVGSILPHLARSGVQTMLLKLGEGLAPDLDVVFLV